MAPLVLIPGQLSDARSWSKVLPGLSDGAHCTFADITGADNMPELAANVLAKAPAGAFALAGHSMGGYVALEILRQAPERASALALLCTNAHADPPEAIELRRRLMQLAENDFEAVADAMLPGLAHPDHLDAAMVAVKTAMIRSVGKDAFLRQQRANIARIDSRPHLGAIACPTLVLASRDDAVMTLEGHIEMARAIPGATLVVLEHCGHMAPLEQPGRVLAELKAWLLRSAA